jgi:hypothetical protein
MKLYLVEQDRMANAQLLGLWVEAFGAELLFLVNKKDRFVKPSNLLQ